MQILHYRMLQTLEVGNPIHLVLDGVPGGSILIVVILFLAGLSGPQSGQYLQNGGS